MDPIRYYPSYTHNQSLNKGPSPVPPLYEKPQKRGLEALHAARQWRAKYDRLIKAKDYFQDPIKLFRRASTQVKFQIVPFLKPSKIEDLFSYLHEIHKVMSDKTEE